MFTVALITARGLLGRRRALLLLPLPLLLVGLAAICRAYDLAPSQWGQEVIVGLGFAVVLPVIALIVGTGVLGSEVDDGTLVHILTKPLPRRDIILAKFGVAVLATALTTTLPLFVAAKEFRYLCGYATNVNIVGHGPLRNPDLDWFARSIRRHAREAGLL